MRLYFEQIPEGVDISEYPEETEFILDDSRPKRDLRHEESAGYRDGWSIACYVTAENCGESYVSQLTWRYRNSPYERLLSWTEQFAPKEFEDFYHGCISPI